MSSPDRSSIADILVSFGVVSLSVKVFVREQLEDDCSDGIQSALFSGFHEQ